MFTGAIKLASIDDYITPSQECIKPLMVPSNQPALVEPNILKATNDGKATVSLTDCLACSGCVTSAQTILIQQMSIKQFKTKAKQGGCILLVSPQSRVAIANHFKIDQKQILPRLELFMKKYFNVTKIYEIVEGIDLAHKLTAQQLTNQLNSETPHLPILSSQCPGWVCYAQKTTSPEVVSHMSQIKSPQQIIASLIRSQQKSHSYIVSIMPCYDKKLEAIRFTTPEGQKQVDLVLTSTQIINLITNPTSCNCSSSQCNCCSTSSSQKQPPQQCKKEFINSNLNQINYSNYYLTPQQSLLSVQDPKSNGYLHHMLHHFKAQNIITKNIRNSDFVEYTVTIDGKQRKMAQCYGFRNIQNIVRQIKNNKCQYVYVQIMACPSGCVNGGGQPKQQGLKSKDISLKLQTKLKQIKTRLQPSQTLEQNKQQYHVKYKALQKNLNTVLNDW